MSRTSSLPVGTTLVGSVEGRGDLVVAGVVEGPIELEGALVIEEGGAVHGDVSVSALTVRGVLTGDASAKESIRIEATAAVVGDVRAPHINVHDGARMRGRVQMTGEPIVPKAARRRRSRELEPPRATAAKATPAKVGEPEAARPAVEPRPPLARKADDARREAGPSEAEPRRPRRVRPSRQGRGTSEERAGSEARGRSERRPEERRPEERDRGAERGRSEARGRTSDRARSGDATRTESSGRTDARRRDEDRGRNERRPEPAVEAATVEATRGAADASAADSAEPPSESEAGGRRRRKRRRRGRKPPPPNIPTVQRQKARRKDKHDSPEAAS